MSKTLATVGSSLPHDSARLHVTGEAIYLDDMPEPPHLLHAAIVHSPHAHARILGIDATAALALPGVKAVITARDIPGVNDVGPILHDEPALAEKIADYHGCPVAAVVATSHALAVRARDLVKVDYEVLPAILSLAEARQAESYVSAKQHMCFGDAETALAKAPQRLQGRLNVGGQDHFYLETHIALAQSSEPGHWHITTSTQHPSEVQQHVALALGVPQAAVTAEVRRMGGGFGGKESQPTIIAVIAAVAALKTGQPVKLRLNRDDDMIITGKRHDFEIEWDVGFSAKGELLGLKAVLATRGGNVADLTPPVLTRALCHLNNCYFIPHVDAIGLPLKTNTVSNTAFRGFGGPQGMIAAEAIIDQIARHLGEDRDIIRARNYFSPSRGMTMPYEQVVDDMIADQLMAALARSADLEQRKQEVATFNAAHRWRKRGLATMPVMFGISFNMPSLNQGGALVHVYKDGSILVNHGGTEMGQGLYTKVAQVVAEGFGCPMEAVVPSATRTDKVPNTSATAASSGSDINGAAALKAVQEIRSRMARVAAHEWGVEAESIVFSKGEVRSDPHSMSFAALATLCWAKRVSLSAEGYYATPGVSWDGPKMKGNPFYYYAYGAAASEVEIDVLTGENRVLRTDIIHDCGASLNPALDKGQIEGGFVQGMGWLTMEELFWNAQGHLKTHAPSTYKIPGSRDVPPDFRVHLLDNAPNRKETVFRSKAVGEPPLMLAISVWLALRDAVAACDPTGSKPILLDAPATPERILAAIEALKSS